jgi:PKD repeat protein
LLQVLLLQAVLGQNIVQIEYFIDNDPGLGLADQLTVAPAPTQDIEFFIDVDAVLPPLSEGKHILTVRARDEFNEWSILESRVFFINSNAGPDVFPPQANINVLEYYIDTDPGVGNRASVPGFIPGLPEPDVTFDVPFTSIGAPGIHSLVLVAQDENGSWSVYETRVYHVVNISGGETFPPTDVIEVEFFIDDDPGVEIATNIAGVSQDLTIDVTDVIAVPLAEGKHVLTLRAKNINGDWGMYETRPFWVKSGTGIPDSDPGSVQVTKLEYFFNDPDPGLDVATEYPITPDFVIDLTADPGVDFPTPPDIPVGINTLTVRAKNALGNWGISETREFNVIDDCDQPVADFSFQLACAGETVQFTDESTSVQPDPTYNWYLDGDGTIDNTTIGDVSFTYQIPGDYTVTLEIYQGQICFNSKSVNITIKPKPVVLFTPEGFIEGSPTNFIVAQSNIDPGAIWEWDFENDAVVDDNTVGNTSYTYPSAAVYTANLRITDNLGCETTYSSNFNIQPAGGGGGSPSSDFVVSAECEGSVTIFTDLSENIPLGAVYSWDFNNDGIEDDNSTGSTLFSYSSPGDYISVLSIDVGGGVILTTQQPVSVTMIPDVDFSVVPVCAGEIVNLTDLSGNLETGVIYSWDFENDGIVDDNTSGDNMHTYTNPGTYLITLKLDNGNGCIVQNTKQVVIDPVPSAEFSYTGSCTGANVIFSNISQNVVTGTTIEWDFENDGIVDVSGINNPSFLFPSAGNYQVRLSLTQPGNCSDVFIETLTIAETPQPNFTFSSSCLSSVWNFLDASQNLSGNPTYSWDLDGDGLEEFQISSSLEDALGKKYSFLINPLRLVPMLFIDGISMEMEPRTHNSEGM